MSALTEAKKRISQIETEILKLVKEATDLSDETGAEFRLTIAYGMGGTYVPSLKKAGKWSESARDRNEVFLGEDGEWERESYRDWIDHDGGWYTSSMSC